MKKTILISLLCLFTGHISAQKYTTYLFAFFANNTPDGEQIRFALSDDGFNYTSLNEGRPVVASDTIAIKKSIRDPHIMRAEDGKTFYMVLTDMRSNEGWQSNDGLILMKSTDLIHWQHTAIDFPTRFPNIQELNADNLHAVWAPQTIWDPVAKKYMVYYSIGRHDWEYPTSDKRFFQPYFKLFYSYANEDFTDLSAPKLLFDFGKASIDGDIVYDKKNKEYVLFFKDEGRSVINPLGPNGGWKTHQGIMRATSKNVTGPYTTEWKYLHKPGQFPVEGSSVFPLINSDEYILMYDCYANGHYQFCKGDLTSFTYVKDTPTKGTFTPRHGSVIHITDAERTRLESWSKLSIAVNNIKKAPTDGLSVQALAQRNTLIEMAEKTLATKSDAKSFNSARKKLEKIMK
ncbi:MAG: glycoside hydrolase family 43 protein [Bacteroidaceae bacterium]|nr:glycoside hydrolase family 43 protein [Bacteroidaceae bacterium]